jgi:uncharacterized protein YlxP (DUF503 family)
MPKYNKIRAVVGICIIHFSLFDSDSLKDKRKIINSIKERVKNKFNVSISEIGENDNYKRGIVGISYISNNSKVANQVLSKIVDYIEDSFYIEINNYEIEII